METINVTQDKTVLLEFCYPDKIFVYENKTEGEGKKRKPILDDDNKPVKKQVAVEIPETERRIGIGGILFEKRAGYKFPVIELPNAQAQRILSAEIKKKTKFFRIAKSIGSIGGKEEKTTEPEKTG